MNIESIVYTKDSIKSLNAKKYVMIGYIVLFALLFVASIVVSTFLFMRAKKDILSFVICCLLFCISVLYIVANSFNIKKICVLNKNLRKVELYEQKLKTPLKINEKSKLSSTAIMFIVSVSLILLASIVSVVFLCLEFSLEMLAETLFMILILGYSSQTLCTTLIEDVMYRKQINKIEKA